MYPAFYTHMKKKKPKGKDKLTLISRNLVINTKLWFFMKTKNTEKTKLGGVLINFVQISKLALIGIILVNY